MNEKASIGNGNDCRIVEPRNNIRWGNGKPSMRTHATALNTTSSLSMLDFIITTIIIIIIVFDMCVCSPYVVHAERMYACILYDYTTTHKHTEPAQFEYIRVCRAGMQKHKIARSTV